MNVYDLGRKTSNNNFSHCLIINYQQHLILFILGNHSLYVSFDSLQGLTLMQGTEQSDFDSLRQGWVKIYSFERESWLGDGRRNVVSRT